MAILSKPQASVYHHTWLTRYVQVWGIDIIAWGHWLILIVTQGPVLKKTIPTTSTRKSRPWGRGLNYCNNMMPSWTWLSANGSTAFKRRMSSQWQCSFQKKSQVCELALQQCFWKAVARSPNATHKCSGRPRTPPYMVRLATSEFTEISVLAFQLYSFQVVYWLSKSKLLQNYVYSLSK